MGDPVALTWREIDVLHLLDARHTYREIARLLGITEETVAKHTSKMYAELSVTGRRAAMADGPRGWA